MSEVGFKKGLGVFDFVRKYWYLCILVIVILPGFLRGVYAVVESGDVVSPLLNFSSSILLADVRLDQQVSVLNEGGVDVLVGRPYPEVGLWKHTVYYWFFLWNVVWELCSLVWLVFFPFYVAFRIFYVLGNQSNPARLWLLSGLSFFAYLFIVNCLVVLYNVVSGGMVIIIPEGLNLFEKYVFLGLKLLPLHGLWSLGSYLFFLVVR